MSGFFLQLLLLFTLPALVACLSAWLTWHALATPWTYVVASGICLYVLYALAMYCFAPKSVGYMVSAVPPGEVPKPPPMLMLLEPYKLPLLLFLLASVPAVVLLLRLFKREAQ